MTSPSSRKEFIAASAGELASSLFDRFKKSAAERRTGATASTAATTTSTAQTTSTSQQQQQQPTAASLITNIAQNIIASSLNSNNNTGSGGISYSKLLSDQLTASNVGNANVKTLTIYDDDNLDDDDFDVAKLPPSSSASSTTPAATMTTTIPTTNTNQSEPEQAQAIGVTSSKSEVNMTDFGTSLNKSTSNNNESTPSEAVVASSTSASKMTGSSSLHRFSTVFDDIMKSDLANSAASEADALRKRLLTKKKSIELSFENIKARTRTGSTSKQQAIDTDTNNNSPTSSSSLAVDDATNKNADEDYKKVIIVKDDTKKTTEIQLISNEPFESSPSQVDEKLTEDHSIPSTQDIHVEDLAKHLTSETNGNRTKPKAKKWQLLFDKRLIGASILIAILLSFLIARTVNFAVLTFGVGIALGSTLTAWLAYYAIKLDLLKYFIKMAPPKGIPNDSDSSQQPQSLLIDTPIKKENKNFDGVYKGWMNELSEVYDPSTYFINKTRSVYLNLDGVMLRIQTTTNRVPKRAVPGENIGTMSFNEQRHYDLTDCEVCILPARLCRKRYWSKKYPICLKGVKLLHTKGVGSTSSSSMSLHESSSAASTPTRDDNNSTAATTSTNELDIDTLVLFGRTDREKEEWFNLFRKASAKKLNDSAYYLRLKRSKLATASSSYSKKEQAPLPPPLQPRNEETTDTKSQVTSTTTTTTTTAGEGELLSIARTERESQTDTGLLFDTTLVFLNTFLIRAFADFFTHKQWIERIQNKMQNKLSKIDVPYFIEELKITGLDLGTVVPQIKQTGEPWYDERGLWVHMDIDYSGGYTLFPYIY